MALNESIAGLNAVARKLVQGAAFKLVETHRGYSVAYDIYRFTSRDGRVFTEFVQAEHSAPNSVIFCALRGEDGKEIPETLWSDKEMADICGIRYAS